MKNQNLGVKRCFSKNEETWYIFSFFYIEMFHWINGALRERFSMENFSIETNRG